MSDASALLFSPDLISQEVVKQLPEGYNCRPIKKDDFHHGFLDVLRVLTTVGDVSEEVCYHVPPPVLLTLLATPLPLPMYSSCYFLSYL